MKKLYILLLLIFPSLLLAETGEYTFVVENTTMVNSYFNIFNALASIFASQDYLDLLQLAFLFGGFIMLTKGVFATYEGSGNAKMISEYGKYIATVVGLLVILGGKSTIWITTNNIPTFCSDASPTTGVAVSGVPGVLAYSFNVANKIGNGLTELAEAAFSNVTESTMTKSDGYLGNLKETIKVLTLDPSKTSVNDSFDFTNMWAVFFSECIYLTSANKGEEGAKIIANAYKSGDLLAYSEEVMNSSFSTTQGVIGDLDVTYMGSTYTCSAFLATLKTLTNDQLSKYACTAPLSNSGVLQLITGNINSGATGAAEMGGIARQSGLINALKASKSANSAGIQGADSFTGGATKSSFNMSNLSTASYMADMMPYIQMVIRAVLYAFFPFIFVVIILPGGLKVLAQYAKTLIWIELWTPTAAILHMFVSIQAEEKLKNMYNTNTGITLMNSVDMLSETTTLASVGAMLYVSVPAITWLMITGSGQMLGNVMSGAASSFGSQLAKDQSGIEQAKDLQRQRINQKLAHDSEGREAALSYGEMMFYENMHKGHQDAGTFASNKDIIKKGGDVAEKTFVENHSRYLDSMTKKEELKTLGVTDKDGNLDYNKLKEVSQKKGDTAGVDAARTMEKYDFNGDKKVSNEEIEQAMTQGTKAEQLKTQEELKKAMGTIAQIGGGSVQTASDVNSKTAVNDQDLKNQTQQKVLDNVNLDQISTSDAKTQTAKTKSNEDTTQADLTEAAKSKLIYQTEKDKKQFNGDEKNQAGVDANQAIVENKAKENIQNTYSQKQQIKAETFDKGVKIEESLQTQEKGISEKVLGNKTAYSRQKDLIEMAAGIDVASKVGKQISEAKSPELKALKEEAMKAGIKENDNLGMGLYMSKRMQDSSSSSNNFDSENFRKKLNLSESEAGALNSLEKVGTGKAIDEVKQIFGEKGVENITMANKLISMGGNAAKLGKSVLDVMSNIAETNGLDMDLDRRQKSLESEMKHNDKDYNKNTKMEKDLKEQLSTESDSTKRKELEKELNSIDKEKNKIETKQDKIQDKMDNIDREKTKNDLKKGNLNKIYNKLAPMMETALVTGSRVAGPTAVFALGMEGDNSSEIPTFKTKEEKDNWEKSFK